MRYVSSTSLMRLDINCIIMEVLAEYYLGPRDGKRIDRRMQQMALAIILNKKATVECLHQSNCHEFRIKRIHAITLHEEHYFYKIYWIYWICKIYYVYLIY